jgi:hypothetical protein
VSDLGERVRKKRGGSEASMEEILMRLVLDLLDRVKNLEIQLQDQDSAVEVAQQSVDAGFEIHKNVLVRLLQEANLFDPAVVLQAYDQEEDAVLGGDLPEDEEDPAPEVEEAVWEVVEAPPYEAALAPHDIQQVEPQDEEP